jgi:hypothetical protein
MKRIFSLLFIFFLVAGISTVNAQKKAKWNEMEEFHKVMSQTFHPAEEGQLEPIKTRSGEMVEKAIAWKKSETPEGYDKKALKKPLKELVKGAKKLDQLVKANAADAEITAKITSLHDVFHEIMDKRNAH